MEAVIRVSQKNYCMAFVYITTVSMNNTANQFFFYICLQLRKVFMWEIENVSL